MIEEVVQSHDPSSFSIESTGSFGQDASWWVQNCPDVLILNLPDDEILQGHFFSKMKKDVPRSLPVIFLCSAISASLMKMSHEFKRVRIIKSPASGFQLYRTITDCLIEYKEGTAQSHPRYLTDQTISVFSDVKSGRMKAQMKNLSISGAFFETDETGLPLKNGELLRISILVGSQKEYVFDCKLVWQKPMNAAGLMGFGVAFVNKDEVYEALLKAL